MLPLLAVLVEWTGTYLSRMSLPAFVMCLGLAFLLLAIFSRRHDMFFVVALLTMIVGLVLIYALADAQGAALPVIPEENSRSGIDHYRSLVVLAWDSFAIATFLLALIWGLQRLFQLRLPELVGILPLGFLAFYSLGLYWLFKAACQEERFLEESGIV